MEHRGKRAELSRTPGAAFAFMQKHFAAAATIQLTHGASRAIPAASVDTDADRDAHVALAVARVARGAYRLRGLSGAAADAGNFDGW